MKLFKAELWKYLHEVRTYYPDHIVSIVVTTIVFYMFLLVQHQQMNQSYVGFVYWYLLSSVISEAAVSVSSEKQMGILDQLIIKPFPFEQLIIVRTLVWLIVNLIKVAIVSLVLSAILSIQISFSGWYIIIFLLTTVGVFGFTLVLVALTLKYTKTASFDSIISYALLFFTGAILPHEMMPEWAVTIGRFLPISLGIEMTQSLIQGGRVTLMEYLLLSGQSVFFLVIGYVLFKKIYQSSKKAGIDRSY